MTTGSLKPYNPIYTFYTHQISYNYADNSEYNKCLEYISIKTKCNISYNGNTHLS